MKDRKLTLCLSRAEVKGLYRVVLAGLQSGVLNSHQKNLACLLAVRIRDLEVDDELTPTPEEATVQGL